MKKEEASKIDNLWQQEAIEKCQELIKHQPVCLFTTSLLSVPGNSRPMSTKEVSDDGSFWFLSSSDSAKNEEIKSDSQVQLYFMNVSDYEFLTIYGRAYISKDPSKIEKYWSDIAKAWFPGGKEDPRITVIEAKPESGYYWDTKSGKFVSLMKILASAVMGRTLQEGVEGMLSRISK